MELIFKDGVYFKKQAGAGRPKQMDDGLIISIYMAAGSSAQEAIVKLEEDKKNAQIYTEETIDLHISTQKIAVINKHNIFKNFLEVRNDVSQSSVIYYRNNIQTQAVCSTEAFDSKFAKGILEKYEPEAFTLFHNELASLIDPKDWTRVSMTQTLDVVLNTNRNITKIETITDPHPAVVEGITRFSLRIIPFEPKDGYFHTLNPHLADFLGRTEHHAYLCAILWSNFIGNLLPYVIYLRGDGGDGKTSFINMLGRLARSFTNFDGGDRFNYFNMFGKSIISLNENESSKLMQNRVVKSITGGNSVQIEGKGKNSYSGQIRGLILIDSNYDLELLNRADEKRRLRYFEVTPITKTDNFVTIAQDEFVGLMGSTPNEFLSYCRNCYNDLQISGSGGLIKELPNHEETFLRLTDPLQEHKFGEFYRQNIEKAYILEGKCEAIDILLALEKKFPKDKFVARGFKKYLEGKYNIKSSGKYFVGLSKFDKELQNAMPTNH